jgi:hypothetical protein
MTKNDRYPERLGILKRLIKTIYESENQMTDEEKIYDLIVQAGEMQQHAIDLQKIAERTLEEFKNQAQEVVRVIGAYTEDVKKLAYKTMATCLVCCCLLLAAAFIFKR